MSSLKYLIVICAFFWATPAYADTHACADCERATVAQAITDAADGDTITIPADECSWTSGVTVPDVKDLIIQGAGSSATIITASPACVVFTLGKSGSRLTAIGLIDGEIKVDGNNFEIDHLSMSFADWSDGISVGWRDDHTPEIATGTIHDNSFTNMRVLVIGTNYGLSESDAQHILWTNEPSLGSQYAVYIEGNTFNGGVNAVDANYGAAFVFRYNTLLNGCYIESHSVQGANRATRTWEIYNNLISNSGDAGYYPFRIRGGTGVIYNNVVSGNWSNYDIAFDNVRSYDSRDVCGECAGASDWDGNEGEGEEAGYPCRDQIGRGYDSTQWDHDPAGAYAQPLAPAYIWGNTGPEGALTVDVINDSGVHIQVNRDYYLSQHPSYSARQCPDPRTGLSGSCSSSTAGAGGYNLSSGITGIGSGGTATTGGNGTITLTSP